MRDRPQRVQRKEKPAACPFCETTIPRPAALSGYDSNGGRCACGAVFLVDETGKHGGQVLLDGLTLLCDGDVDRAMALDSKADYELRRLGYRPRTHSLEPALPMRVSFGRPRLYFLRRVR